MSQFGNAPRLCSLLWVLLIVVTLSTAAAFGQDCAAFPNLLECQPIIPVQVCLEPDATGRCHPPGPLDPIFVGKTCRLSSAAQGIELRTESGTIRAAWPLDPSQCGVLTYDDGRLLDDSPLKVDGSLFWVANVFDKLVELDRRGNSNGFFDQGDSDRIVIWFDRNRDGRVTNEELQPINDLLIGLDYWKEMQPDEHDSVVAYASVAWLADGSALPVLDVLLTTMRVE